MKAGTVTMLATDIGNLGRRIFASIPEKVRCVWSRGRGRWSKLTGCVLDRAHGLAAKALMGCCRYFLALLSKKTVDRRSEDVGVIASQAALISSFYS